MVNRNLLRQPIEALLGLCLLLTACQEYTHYHSYQPVATTGWQRSDTIVYTLPTSLPPNNYEIQIGIRHLESYTYRDLWLEISHNLADSTCFEKDTLHLYLADKNGNWYGNGIGGLLQYEHHEPLILKSESHHPLTFRIIHLMEDSPLKSIYDVGIKINSH